MAARAYSLQEKSSAVVIEEGYRGTNDTEPRRSVSNDRTSNATSSLRRRFLSLSHVQPSQIDEDNESECVSEAGDIGDRALHSNRHSESGSICLFPSEDVQLQTYGLWGRDPVTSKAISPVTPLPEEIISPLSTGVIISEDKKPENTTRLPKLLEYGSCMTHLAVFGILGVGSLLMGWFGVVFKVDLSYVSDYLVIGLTTGYLGSLTTFSGWNQKMLELSVERHWVFALLGFLIGLFLAAYSIIFGVETAKGFRQILERNSVCGITSSRRRWRVDSFKRHLVALAVLLLMLSSLWSISGILLREEFNSSSTCVVAALSTVKKAVSSYDMISVHIP
ncbi:hypothetical protein DVH24_025357 [Malus domestica]|uniref:Fluoride ion transporter CrcB n=1 Tax=Malus domestica TaxID=3750 RepID=A0A498HK57_MALDO|nr:hypothetical protein DVH24_025357 [Malus domestica]